MNKCFLTKKNKEYDVCKRLGFLCHTIDKWKIEIFNFKTSIVKNTITKKIYIFIMEKGKEKKFNKYLKNKNCKFIKWLS